MENFVKYYSYNQVIEEHDVLIMTQQEYVTNKDKLDNPKLIVCVNRQGGPKEPKAPRWFTTYMNKFEKDLWIKIDQKLDDKFKAFAKLNNLKNGD